MKQALGAGPEIKVSRPEHFSVLPVRAFRKFWPRTVTLEYGVSAGLKNPCSQEGQEGASKKNRDVQALGDLRAESTEISH
ncbi:hypothetical protein Q0M94_20720 (plasmid) [Deinococcus radiomollis]|uniref:hypothetical protein n=1 Tax=Deinococcus radiomollis TaxID=468916 RepID=UPI003891E662